MVSPTEDRRRKLSALAKNILLQTHFVTHHRWVVCRESNVLRLINDGSCWSRCSQAFVCSTALTYTHTTTLTPSLVAAVRTFNALAVCAQPRTLPLSIRWRPVPLLYVDAFFRLGNDQFTPDDIRLNKVAVDWRQTGHLQNGFGAVLFPVQGLPQFFHGHVPAKALRSFCFP